MDKPTLIRSMMNIMNLPVEENWTIIAYALNKDIVKNGQVDPLRGLITPLGTYKTEEKASLEAQKIMEQTGHPAIKIIKNGIFAELTTEPNQSIIKTVHVDTHGKIVQMENEAFEKQKELYDKKINLEKEMLKECEQECDVDHIEHYKRAAYLVTKHYLAYLELKKQTEQMYKNYELRKKVLLEHYSNHPEHEEQFLPYLKEKLMNRDEKELYEYIESGYLKYKDLFLKE